MRQFYTFALGCAVCLGSQLMAQSTAPPPCSAPEASQLDFWVGTWDVSWDTTGGFTITTGTNTIQRTHGGCVIHESFSMDGETPFAGESWSVYNPPLGIWQQTWVDNSGGYLVLTGGMKGDTMELVTAVRPLNDTLTVKQRMIFYDITSDRFTWDWQNSNDSGKTWKQAWRINYQRRE